MTAEYNKSDNGIPRHAAKASIREKALREIREMAVLTAYLYVCFLALILFKVAVLQAENIHYAPFGLAAVKAVICAKFMMIGHMLHIGERFKNHPLIIPILYKSLVFVLFLVFLTIIEEILTGMIHGGTVAESLAEVADGTLAQMTATSFVVMLILIPYFAFRALGELVGERNLIRLFFKNRRGDD